MRDIIASKSIKMNYQTIFELSIYFLSVGVLMYIFLKVYLTVQTFKNS